MADDLFSQASATAQAEEYTAEDIEVLEGLEPVRRRPGMYIGGTDEMALHHLVSEVFDNAMDEVVAGHANKIEMSLAADDSVTIRDNGRGIPIDPHPKFPKKSALEVIMTTLHSGGKFGGKAYNTSGGLHGVGVSVVNALSDRMTVEVARNKTLWRQEYSRGEAKTKLEKVGNKNRRGTTITFHPDVEIFGDKIHFRPGKLYKLARSKAYLFKGAEIHWSCDPEMVEGRDDVPEKEVIHFPNGLVDFLEASLGEQKTITKDAFVGEAALGNGGRVEWAIHWTEYSDDLLHSYCNTIPTPLGGTHETGLRAALTKGLKEFGEMSKNKKVNVITADDVLGSALTMFSVFIKEPQFQGQTKEKLVSQGVAKSVENAIRDHFDLWLSRHPVAGERLLEFIISKAEERLRRKKQRDVSRKSIVQKLRLPGKLADCTREMPEGTEIFLVEGDSAGGSAKQARNRETQAVLPLRGKILNVASATADKIRANQEIADMLLALGCGSGAQYSEEELRYEKVIIMTDADVDGAHIASLLMTYFYSEMPKLIENGHLYLACPPLYRVSQGANVYYAHDDKDKDRLVKELSKGNRNVDIGRFKGLGEMSAQQLKETTMSAKDRVLLRVMFADDEGQGASKQVERLMGRKPELRLQFIQEQSQLKGDELAEALDL